MRYDKTKLTNLLVFSGLLFTTARMIRETDNLYALALLSFIGIWILNYKIFWDLKFKKTVIWFLPFGIWATISAIWSLEPFISLTRGLFYTFIMLTAVLIGIVYKNRFEELLKLITILNTLFVMLSVISLISGIPSDAWTANHGMGFTSIFTHQNTLASVLLFTLIGPFYFIIKLFLSTKKQRQSSLTNIFFYTTLIFLNHFFIIISYSRAVMLALFIGGLVFILLLGNIKFKILFLLIMILFLSSIFLIFKEDITRYLKKGAGTYFANREILWKPSYEAALNGGIIGLGYGVTDPKVESNYKKENKFGELKREKGNSVLALVEEVGIVGLILFFIPIFYVFASYRNYNYSINQSSLSSLPNLPAEVGFPSSAFPLFLLFSFLIAFIVHTQFEGWWTGISGLFLFTFILFLSNFITYWNFKNE